MLRVSVSYEVSVPSRPRIGVASRPITRIRSPAIVMADSRNPRFENRRATRSPATQVTSEEIGWNCSSGCPSGAMRSPFVSNVRPSSTSKGFTPGPLGATVSG